MLRLTLALFLGFSLPSAAVDACLALNLLEIRATLRGAGVVVPFHSKTTQEHVSLCAFARLSAAGSAEENLKRLQTEDPLILTVGIIDNAGIKGFDFLKAEAGTADSAVPGLGDRAVLRHAAKSAKLFVASGQIFLTLGIGGENVAGKRDQDLIELAREAVSTNFDGSKLTKYEVAERALANDRETFEVDPKNFAVFLMAIKRFDEARTYNLRAASINPNDAEVLYEQGVIDWQLTHQPRMQVRASLGLPPSQPLPASACAELRAANLEKVEEGIVALSKVLTLRPDADAAMFQIDMLYRERADYQCGDAAARSADLKAADDWASKFTVTNQANRGKSIGGSVLSFTIPPSQLPPSPQPPSANAHSSSQAGGVTGGVIGTIIGSAAPAVAPDPATAQRVQVAGFVTEGLLLTQVQPIYPPLARKARIQGTVVLKAVINKDGSIESLTVVTGHPFLAPAAIDAVKQWQYRPYLLNGYPVEVDTEILVNFSLSAKDPPPSSTSTTPNSQTGDVAGSVTNAHANGVTVGASQRDQGPAPNVASSVKKTNLIRNTAPEDMWSRLTQCVFPATALVAGNSYMEGTVDLGFLVSRDGNVVNVGVRGGDSSLRTPAIRAIRQWKFRPDAEQGVTTFSRVRAFVRFNADGTSSVELARALAPDDFGDPGNATADSSHVDSNVQVVPRPLSAPQCKSQVPWISTREVN
jgi:TonB family protein